MITLEFDDEGNVVRKPKEKKSQSFHFVPRSLGEGAIGSAPALRQW